MSSVETDPIAAARALLARVTADAESVPLVPPCVPMASPSWRGIDATTRLAETAAGAFAVKIPDLDAALFAHPATVVMAAGAAAAVGVGPRVVAADSETGALVMEALGEGWRVATLADLGRPDIRDAVLAARRRLHAGPALPRQVDLATEIPGLLEAARAAGALLPVDIEWLADHVAGALTAIAAAGVDLVPAHGDGNASNVMLGPEGQVRLLDYDVAGMMDPFLDLGSHLAEAYEFDPPAREAFEVAHGRFDERLFNRARLYGVADDLRWGLIGAVLAATSRRTQLEFLKFADWRFLRCRLAVRDPRFEERVRRL